MNKLATLLALAFITAAGAAYWQFEKAQQLAAELARLRTQSAEAEARAKAAQAVGVAKANSELERLRTEAQEVHRLRNEATQLRRTAQESDKLRQENQQLRNQSQQARPAPAAGTIPALPTHTPSPFAREHWRFSGYASPEATLISAIWAMKEGRPQAYLDSLSADEQARMAKQWQSQSEAAVSAKHQKDVEAITGLRITGRQSASADEMVLGVFLEGVNRQENVLLKRSGTEWKFGGFIREPGR